MSTSQRLADTLARILGLPPSRSTQVQATSANSVAWKSRWWCSSATTNAGRF